MPSASAIPKGSKATPKKGGTKSQGSKAQGSKPQGSKSQSPKVRASKTQTIKAQATKAQVFLVALKRRREALRVYAVLTATEAVALAIVEAAGAEDVTVEPVGRLSKKLARPLKLLTGEPRLI